MTKTRRRPEVVPELERLSAFQWLGERRRHRGRQARVVIAKLNLVEYFDVRAYPQLACRRHRIRRDHASARNAQDVIGPGRATPHERLSDVSVQLKHDAQVFPHPLDRLRAINCELSRRIKQGGNQPDSLRDQHTAF